MALLQDLVHKIETAAENKYFRYVPAILAIILVALVYDLRQYRNFSSSEAMDAAQLGRRLSEGKGYTTLCIRPLSMHLIQRTQRELPMTSTNEPPDFARIRDAHPDLANPPVYPVLLAGAMKVLPFNYVASTTQHFWSRGDHMWRYQPDFLIALLNQLLFAVVIGLAFFWALRLFDPGVAWTSAVVLLGTEVLWRFSVSGLSTMLLLLFFMALIWCLTLLEAEARRADRRPSVLLAAAAAAGVLGGLGGLTRYSFGWLIIPTVMFVFAFGGSRRAILSLITLLGFAVVMAPWITRNYLLCGAPFGTATYHVLEGTILFPGTRLERSLNPNIQFFMSPIRAKLLSNLPPLLNNVFSHLGGGWVGAFFLVGLAVGFRNPSIRRMRYLLLACFGVFILVQALGRTDLSTDSPEINSENLLVLLLPLVVIYGVSLFFTLLDQITFAVPTTRLSAVGVFGVVACLPMIFAVMSQTSPMVYPPYHPLLIQQTAAWMKPNELMMSDVPWAVAWYGDRQCVWLTLNAVPDEDNGQRQENFFAINDFHKAIRALYLTQKSTDGRLVSDWIRAGESSWGKFIVDSILKKEVPPDFPLRQMPTGYLPEQLFLADWKRWR